MDIKRNDAIHDHTTRFRGNHTQRARTNKGMKGNQAVNDYHTLP